MLVAASKVTPGDNDSWLAAWSATAEDAEAAAKESGGHPVSAGNAWLRATEYWRQAIFFIRHDTSDPRLQAGWKRHVAAFRAALPLLPGAGGPYGGLGQLVWARGVHDWIDKVLAAKA